MPGEMTSHFPATIFAIGNMFGCATGFAVPYVIGVILESGSGQDPIFLWSKTFYLSAVMAVFGALIFISFGDASRQPWDTIPDDECVLEDFQDAGSSISISSSSHKQQLRPTDARRGHTVSPYMSCA